MCGINSNSASCIRNGELVAQIWIVRICKTE
jgi:hypothetical protein